MAKGSNGTRKSSPSSSSKLSMLIGTKVDGVTINSLTDLVNVNPLRAGISRGTKENGTMTFNGQKIDYSVEAVAVQRQGVVVGERMQMKVNGSFNGMPIERVVERNGVKGVVIKGNDGQSYTFVEGHQFPVKDFAGYAYDGNAPFYSSMPKALKKK